jgi:recombinational DNA repair protein (RecF pathway)
LLNEIGLMPRFAECVECRRPMGRQPVVYFSASAGGVLCRDCEMHHIEKRRAPAGILSAGAAGLTASWGSFELLNYFLNHVAGRKFETQDYLKAFLAG